MSHENFTKPTGRSAIIAAANLASVGKTLAARRWLREARRRAIQCCNAIHQRKPCDFECASIEIAAIHIWNGCEGKPSWEQLDAPALFAQLDQSALAPWADEVIMMVNSLYTMMHADGDISTAKVWRIARDLDRLTMQLRLDILWREHLPLFQLGPNDVRLDGPML